MRDQKRRRMPFRDDMEPAAFGTPRGFEIGEDEEQVIQCVNRHWALSSDIDENGHCSQCQAEGLVPEGENDE